MLTFHYLIKCVLPVNEPGGNYISFFSEEPFETNLPVLRCSAMQQQRTWHVANDRSSDMCFGVLQTSWWWSGQVPLELHSLSSLKRKKKVTVCCQRSTHSLPECIYSKNVWHRPWDECRAIWLLVLGSLLRCIWEMQNANGILFVGYTFRFCYISSWCLLNLNVQYWNVSAASLKIGLFFTCCV